MPQPCLYYIPHPTPPQSIRTGHKVARNLHWLHYRLSRRHHLGYALLAAAAAWIHRAYGAPGVGEAFFLAATYMVNITYKLVCSSVFLMRSYRARS